MAASFAPLAVETTATQTVAPSVELEVEAPVAPEVEAPATETAEEKSKRAAA